jgi:hypothetical protein
LEWVLDLEEDLTGFVFEVLGFAVCLAVFLAVFLGFDLSTLVAAKAEAVCSKKKRGKKSKINRKVYIILQLFFIGSF